MRLGLCLGQYVSEVSVQHPGCRHALSGLLPMGYHLHGKRKNAEANNTHDHLVMSLAPAFYAQAVYIQDHFVLTAAAVDRQAFSLGFATDTKQSFIAFADGASDVSPLHFNYSTTIFTLQ